MDNKCHLCGQGALMVPYLLLLWLCPKNLSHSCAVKLLQPEMPAPGTAPRIAERMPSEQQDVEQFLTYLKVLRKGLACSDGNLRTKERAHSFLLATLSFTLSWKISLSWLSVYKLHLFTYSSISFIHISLFYTHFSLLLYYISSHSCYISHSFTHPLHSHTHTHSSHRRNSEQYINYIFKVT